jgi:putrescine transport system permease protein
MKLERTLGLLPALWLLLFGLLPLLVLGKVSVASMLVAQPPFTPLLDASGALAASLDNYRFLTGDALYLDAYLASLRIAGVATLACLPIGYPLAYALARLPPSARAVGLMLVVLPFWSSFLIRIYALIGLIKPHGTLPAALAWLGIGDGSQSILHSEAAVVLGIAYAYLPLMVLPLYATLSRLDVALLEAASDLGATRLRRFVDVTVPLSLPGIAAGCLLVFIPAVGEFVIPDLLGGASTLMIGKVLWQEFFLNGDWPLASAVAVVMLGVLVVPLLAFERAASRSEAAQ